MLRTSNHIVNISKGYTAARSIRLHARTMVEQAASDERKSELIAAYEDINEQVKAAAASSTRQASSITVL